MMTHRPCSHFLCNSVYLDMKCSTAGATDRHPKIVFLTVAKSMCSEQSMNPEIQRSVRVV